MSELFYGIEWALFFKNWGQIGSYPDLSAEKTDVKGNSRSDIILAFSLR